jgi:Neprosin
LLSSVIVNVVIIVLLPFRSLAVNDMNPSEVLETQGNSARRRGWRIAGDDERPPRQSSRRRGGSSKEKSPAVFACLMGFNRRATIRSGGFSTLGALAEWVGFWGEVGTESDPQSDATPMGSGARAEAGWTKAAFQIGVNGPFWQQAGTATADDSQKYDIKLFAESGSNWGSYFYAGG